MIEWTRDALIFVAGELWWLLHEVGHMLEPFCPCANILGVEG